MKRWIIYADLHGKELHEPAEIEFDESIMDGGRLMLMHETELEAWRAYWHALAARMNIASGRINCLEQGHVLTVGEKQSTENPRKED